MAALVVVAFLAGAVTGAAGFLAWGAAAVVVPLGVLVVIVVASVVALRRAAHGAGDRGA